MIKPEFWTSETLARVSRESRLTFIGIWNHCDDYGVILNSPRRILGDVYPVDESVSEKDIKNEIGELLKEELLVNSIYNNKNYLIIRAWKEHQKVDRPSTRFFIPPEKIGGIVNDSRVSRECGSSVSMLKEKEKEKEKVEVERESLSKKDYAFFMDRWNKNLLPKILKLTDTRINKIKARLKKDGDFEKHFEICIEKIKQSSFLQGENNNSWKATFDWLIENESNYMKVIEDNYSKSEASKETPLEAVERMVKARQARRAENKEV